jgi:hypothetical protein
MAPLALSLDLSQINLSLIGYLGLLSKSRLLRGRVNMSLAIIAAVLFVPALLVLATLWATADPALPPISPGHASRHVGPSLQRDLPRTPNL